MPSRCTLLLSALALCTAASAHDGDLDPTFGAGGTTVVGFGAPGWVYDLAIDAGGKIVLAGRVDGGDATDADFAAVRLTRDGRPDTTFGSGGRVEIPVTPGAAYDEADGVLVQGDGRIVLAGGSDVTEDNRDFALVRLDDDGSPDPTFGSGGKVFVGFDLGLTNLDEAHAVVQQADGKLVVAGSAEVEGRSYDFAIARIETDGSLDASFGEGGRLTFDFHDSAPNFDLASGVAIDAAGRILVAGFSRKAAYDDDFAIARLTADGAFDPTFGDAGRATIAFDLGGDFADDVEKAIIAPDGSIYLVGIADIGSSHGTRYVCAAAKLKSDGALDTAWGSGGKMTMQVIPGDNDSELCTGAALQPDGKLVLAGSVTNGIAMIRLGRDGNPDPAFGAGGVALITGATGWTVAFRDGGLVFGGVTPYPDSDFLAGRVTADTIFGDGFD
jgi:uncharacterized delta-60 repeat protein